VLPSPAWRVSLSGSPQGAARLAGKEARCPYTLRRLRRLADSSPGRHRGPAVLVSQIQAGGVGLNIQSASVVILTEPQWKPTIEDQAIARCHRMGEVRSVNVHRLLAEDTVDQRMLEILATKAALFDEYVRRSELKDHSPDAVDVSDLKTTQQVGTQAEAERQIIERERKRLRMETEP
jgi:hypothetical protein